MKKLVTVLLLTIAVLTFAFSRSALAGDAITGSKIFSANCSACHLGGNNVIMANKTLKKEALEKYGMNSLEAITNQVKSGKNAMPAFGGRLSDKQIEDVATYVFQQAQKGW
ncbi:cytochrome c6 PetJ [Aerosakkonemataceae cyanobacterium BLCC-F154]|uniref:Cytochrome c6 n=1 Tax=Floridaenema fluviatile BLCC-F154 TaxID=3153640 RepID=A0ABV4Y9D6_9CYAN